MMDNALAGLLRRFVPEHTGGNCWALVLRTRIPNRESGETQVWMTDGNLGIDFGNMAEGCLVEVGWYADDEAPCEGRALRSAEFSTLEEALLAVAVWMDTAAPDRRMM